MKSEEKVPKEADKQHSWEIVKMSDGRRVKRCRLCLYAYKYGHDLPCPSSKGYRI